MAPLHCTSCPETGVEACIRRALLAQEKLSNRTIDDELVADPALREEVDQEISKGSYY